jgi:hypothetical protein
MIYLNKKLDSDSFENITSKAITMLFYDAKEFAVCKPNLPSQQISNLRHYQQHEK